MCLRPLEVLVPLSMQLVCLPPPYTKTSSIRPSPPGKLNLRSASFSSVPPFSHLDTLLIFFVSFFFPFLIFPLPVLDVQVL